MKLFKNLEYTFYLCNRWNDKGGARRLLARKIMNVTNIIHSSDVSCEANIGTNVRFGHGGIGVVIHAKTSIGNDCYIMQGVTIGGKKGGYPIIGDNVTIGTNSVVLGGVHIGNNSTIGALSLVIRNVEANVIAAGIPTKVISVSNIEIAE